MLSAVYASPITKSTVSVVRLSSTMIGDATCAATTRACEAPLLPYLISAVPTMSLFSGSLATVPTLKPRAASSTLVDRARPRCFVAL